MNATRQRLVAIMDATVRNAAGWHYAQFRPCGSTVTLEQAEQGTVWADCSAGYALICRLAGAPNPLHAGAFDGRGWTGSAWAYLQHIALADAQVGDCVIYGVGGYHHIAAVREPGPDPLLWSHGGESGPIYIRASVERAWQPEPPTWARLMPADAQPAPPPPVDAYWAWLRWYLGEGEFKGHGKDPAVRPKDALYPIPSAWWDREKAFLAAREKMLP